MALPMDVTLRNATIADSNQISAMVSSLALEYIGPSLGEGGIGLLLASMDADETRQRIDDKWFHLCAIYDDEMIGVVVVKPECHLYHLFVLTEFQRKGVGTKLFAAADAATLAQTQSHLATVNASLNVVPVYERLGFTIDGPINDTNGVRSQPMVRTNGSR